MRVLHELLLFDEKRWNVGHIVVTIMLRRRSYIL